MNKALLILRKIDLFGKPLIFEEKDSQKHHTILGNLMTFLIILTCLIIGFMFGNEIYERKTPTVINSEEIIETSRFTFREYPVMFSFAYFDGTPVYDSQLAFDLKIGVLSVGPDLKTTFKEISGWFGSCNPEMFEEKYRDLVNLTLVNNANAGPGRMEIFCPDVNLFVQNGYTTLNSTFINFRFAPCNPSVKTCHPNIERVSKDAYIVVRTVDAFIDPKNYTHPINYYNNIYNYQVSSAFMKRNYFNIEKSKVVTHKGWLLENVVEEEFFTLKDVSKDINPTFRNEIFQVTFSSPNRRHLIIRRYMKIQDLFASIGGFFNFLLIGSTILLSDYVDFNYYFNYLKLIKDDTHLKNPKRSKTIEMLVRNESMREHKKESKLNSINELISKMNDSNAINLVNNEQLDKNQTVKDSSTVQKSNFFTNNYVKINDINISKEISFDHPTPNKQVSSPKKNNDNLNKKEFNNVVPALVKEHMTRFDPNLKSLNWDSLI